MSPRGRTALLVIGVLLADALFLRAVIASGDRFGIWDWDYQCSLLEAARKTIVEYGQWPLWNPWLGGGHTLAGHPFARTASPSFLPVLLFGTIPGVKVDVFVYMVVTQLGTALLLRRLGCGWLGAVVGALVASWGGCYAMHVAHGHFEWIAYAWVPWMLASLERAVRTRAWSATGAAGAFAALTWVDGGPYQLAFLPLFVGAWAVTTSIDHRSPRPLLVASSAGLAGLVFAAFKILPVVAFTAAYPRKTIVENAYYGAPFPIGVGDVLWQMFLSRAQTHDPNAFMPFRINVGAYVGVLPLLFAVAALLLAPRRSLRWLALLAASLVLTLSAELPFDVWALLHRLPGYVCLQIPARFNAFVLLVVAILAGLGADAVARRGRSWAMSVVLAAILTAIDLLVVTSPVLDVAFSVPPVTIDRPTHDFTLITLSNYTKEYARTALRPVSPINWTSASLPYVRANLGVLRSYVDLPYPRMAIPSDRGGRAPKLPVFVGTGKPRIVGFTWTPNTVGVEVDGDGGTIVVNRNAHPGWVLSHVEPTPSATDQKDPVELTVDRGLLALRVPPGHWNVAVTFHPPLFATGVGVSVLAWLVFGLVVRRELRSRDASTTARYA